MILYCKPSHVIFYCAILCHVTIAVRWELAHNVALSVTMFHPYEDLTPSTQAVLT